MAKKSTRKNTNMKNFSDPAQSSVSTSTDLPSIPQEPPRVSRVPLVGDLRNITSALVVTIDGIMRDPSIARRKSRIDANNMLDDPRINQPLMKRKLATTQLKWSIIPEDERDAGQIEAAKLLTDIISRMDFYECFDHMMDALFYGIGCVELLVNYDSKRGYYYIHEPKPIHPDSIVHDLDGNLYLRVGAGYQGHDMRFGFESRVRPLQVWERDLLAIHIYDHDAPEFFNPYETAALYHGRGLREKLWQAWYISHQIHKQWVRFLERFASGVLIVVHADNEAARAAASAAVRSYKDGDFILMPIAGNLNEIKAFDIQIKEAPSNTANLFREYIDEYIGRQFRLTILGQTLTDEAGSTGLGSGLAEVHKDMFEMIIRYDSRRLANSITDQIVRKLQRWNNILPDINMRFEFTTNEQKTEERMSAIKSAYDMGVTIRAEDIRQVAGLVRPDEDDEVIGAQRVVETGQEPMLDDGDVIETLNTLFPEGGDNGRRIDDLYRRTIG